MSFVECERTDTHTTITFRLSPDFELPESFKTYSQAELESYIVLLSKTIQDATKEAEVLSQKKNEDNMIKLVAKEMQNISFDKMIIEKDKRIADKDKTYELQEKRNKEAYEIIINEKDKRLADKDKAYNIQEQKNKEQQAYYEEKLSNKDEENEKLKEELMKKKEIKTNSSKKGTAFENAFTEVAYEKKGWKLEKTSKLAKATDRMGLIHNLKIRFELKDYTSTKNVSQKDIETFYTSIRKDTGTNIGMFIVTEKNPVNKTELISYEITQENQLLVFISHFRDEISEDFGFSIIDTFILLWKKHLENTPSEQVDLKPLIDSIVNELVELHKDICGDSKVLDEFNKQFNLRISEKKN